MNYENAADILPEDLLKRVQKFAAGKLIYVPETISKRSWGEISGYKRHSSGHIYFTLKEESAVMSCVMFAGYRKGLDFVIKEGLKEIDKNIFYLVCDSYEVSAKDGK